MWTSMLLLLLLRSVGAFVYSCEEVNRLMNSDLEYSKYACIVTQEGYSNYSQLATTFINFNETLYSFAEIAQNELNCIENNVGTPWMITGDDKPLDCDPEFTLILRSDEFGIVNPQKDHGMFSAGSGVFAVPRTGMWLNRMSARGEGNVTVYTGAGSGEQEQRYLLQSWPCESLPDWIYSLDGVITIEADPGCSYLLHHSSDLSFDGRVSIFRHDRVVVLSSGYSDDLQNRQGIESFAYVKIGDCERSNVDVSMQLQFDSENAGPLDGNTGTVGLMKGFSGAIYYFRNGTFTDNFHADYFEIRWVPKRLSGNEVSSNHDNIYVDITVSPYNDEFDCPDGYSVVSSDDNQHWCYTMIWPVPPAQGFTFSDANELCTSFGDSLPIVTSEDVNDHLWKFATIHFGLDGVWLGVVCDTVSGSLKWEDGQPLDYDAFDADQGNKTFLSLLNFEIAGNLCSNSVHFAQRRDTKEWATFNGDYEIGYAICARKAVANPSFTPTTTQTTTSMTTTGITTTATEANDGNANGSPGLPTWAIVIIIVCIIFFCAACIGIILLVRRQKRLNAKMVEERIDKAKQIDGNSQHPNSRYYDMRNEWEIERRFVSIETSRLLGEGAFGSVFLGRVLAKNIPIGVGRSIAELSALTNNNDTVAVKMLHENADSQRELEFRAEIELMKRIGYHERLVNMLACVTISAPVLLISEYCANGDLLNFLRERRKFMLEHPDETKSAEIITAKKQLMFAIQIAYGLEFLSSQGFIHRDVAARNIMVDQEESCKIGDFGLARSIGEKNENYHAQGGKLPLKWMSPEAIDKFFFSPASDVWSFGVLLFEIVTLGGTPYAGWPAAELLPRLKRGDRMGRPDNCTETLYETMCGCWYLLPCDRPTFTELRKHLGHLLEDINQDDYYLKLNAHANYYLLESNASA